MLKLVFLLPPDSTSHPGVLVVAAAPVVKRSVVLIFSEDPLAAALLGAAVETAGFRPAFPAHGDAPRDALLRVRPGLVLVECDHAGACAPSFVGPALMTGPRSPAT